MNLTNGSNISGLEFLGPINQPLDSNFTPDGGVIITLEFVGDLDQLTAEQRNTAKAGIKTKIATALKVAESRVTVRLEKGTTTAERRAEVLQAGQPAIIAIVDVVPELPPVEPTTRVLGSSGDDDEFPGWAIALCVILPITAVIVGAVAYFVTQKPAPANLESEEQNAPDAEQGPTKDGQQ